jgi:hypothetical protein
MRNNNERVKWTKRGTKDRAAITSRINREDERDGLNSIIKVRNGKPKIRITRRKNNLKKAEIASYQKGSKINFI